ncbi:hypothetical protein RIR_jg28010.t1 [Rhizophagus irregularis DAOM 181602=DAOM 197198]|nr:hypothetical protein RIR_jg28010.t1 [Rhizophagus irregularis DAOM 181602=DAOM 197198]
MVLMNWDHYNETIYWTSGDNGNIIRFISITFVFQENETAQVDELNAIGCLRSIRNCLIHNLKTVDNIVIIITSDVKRKVLSTI